MTLDWNFWRVEGFKLKNLLWRGGGVWIFPGTTQTSLTNLKMCKRTVTQDSVLNTPGGGFPYKNHRADCWKLEKNPQEIHVPRLLLFCRCD